MYRLVVRAKKDSDAAKAMVRAFYPQWGIEVYTLKGARTPDRALEALGEAISEDAYVIVLLGREDAELAALERETPLNVVFHVIRYSKVRNARIYNLFRELERARAALRNSVTWRGGSYVFTHKAPPLFECREPAYDVFLGLGRGFKVRLEELVGELGENPLLVRMLGGLHAIYSGPVKVAEAVFPDDGVPRGVRLKDDRVDVGEDELIVSNEEVIRAHETVSLGLLKRWDVEIDEVLVPVSGGKDSTAALALARKAFGAAKLTAVYVDTGVDFPQNREYVERVVAKLGVRLEVEYASVREEVRARGFPAHGSGRWCTALKLEALRRAIRRVAQTSSRPIIVVGDRDAESEARSRRPPVRVEDGILTLAPLKQWGTALVQLYLLREGLGLNPLYLAGFYRIGCYICPALRSWELYVMTRDEELAKSLRGAPLLDEYLRHRGVSRRWGSGARSLGGSATPRGRE
ncbi:MAG: phosphoadenosine phosphosulfate reductase [Thermoprotei archaeon]|nr:MAG: phosphoadenosine phosphosulfate reductase [Thermoprotei archaeon]